jgi:hypothetical protein
VLADLAPSDGVMPHYLLTKGYALGGITLGADDVSKTGGQNADGWLPAIQVADSLSGATAGAAVWPSGVQAWGAVSGSGQGAEATASADSYLWLSPHSSVTISANYHPTGSSDSFCTPQLGCSSMEASAWFNWAGMGLSPGASGGTIGADAANGDPGGALRQDGIMTVTFSNASDKWQRGLILFRTSVDARIQAVPEPATTPMLAGGLLLAGAAVRRRRQRG